MLPLAHKSLWEDKKLLTGDACRRVTGEQQWKGDFSLDLGIKKK